MRVNFLIVGAQKGGTTALQHFLADHPEIAWGSKPHGNRKEVHYFDDDRYFRERPDYDAYHAFFPSPGGRTAIGEATPIYMYWPGTAERIRAYNPEMKLLFLLRDPVERAFSHFKMLSVRDKEPRSFARAIREEQRARELCRYVPHRLYSYVDRGFYARQIEHLLTLFPRDQMLFLRSDALKTRHTETIDRVCRFLGVRELHHDHPETLFATPGADMPAADHRFLRGLYAPDVARLEHLLGWDLSAWRAPAPPRPVPASPQARP